MAKGAKTGGREAGVPNKVTREAREKFKWLLDSYSAEDMQADIKLLAPKDRLSFITDIAEFIIPKLSRAELTGKNGKDLVSQPFLFIPADKLTEQQIDKYLDRGETDTNDESI